MGIESQSNVTLSEENRAFWSSPGELGVPTQAPEAQASPVVQPLPSEQVPPSAMSVMLPVPVVEAAVRIGHAKLDRVRPHDEVVAQASCAYVTVGVGPVMSNVVSLFKSHSYETIESAQAASGSAEAVPLSWIEPSWQME